MTKITQKRNFRNYRKHTSKRTKNTKKTQRGGSVSRDVLSRLRSIVTACRAGDYEIVREHLLNPIIRHHLKRGFIEDDEQLNLLHIACRHNHMHILRMLLSHPIMDMMDGRSVNKKTPRRVLGGVTPLHMACIYVNIEMLRLLLAHKDIDVNKRGDHGATPLWMACQKGHDGLVQLLLNHTKIEVNKSRTGGIESTPLCIACQNGHEEVVKMLLEYDGINVDSQTSVDSMTPLHIACSEGYDRVVRLLLEHNNNISIINQPTQTGKVPLSLACRHGHHKVVRLLLDHDTSTINSANNDGVTPLFYACQFNKTNDKIIKMLLDKGADFNQVGIAGWSPLFVACWVENNEAVTELLKRGADPNISTSREHLEIPARATPLFVACMQDHKEIVRMLLTNKAIDVNKQTHSGLSPFNISCIRDNGFIVKLLLADGRTVRPFPVRDENTLTNDPDITYNVALKHLKRSRRALFRGLVRASMVFRRMRLRAAETAYVPGGTGFVAAEQSFRSGVNRQQMVNENK